MYDVEDSKKKALREYVHNLKQAKDKAERRRPSGDAHMHRTATRDGGLAQELNTETKSRRASTGETRGRKARREDESHTRNQSSIPSGCRRSVNGHVAVDEQCAEGIDHGILERMDKYNKKLLGGMALPNDNLSTIKFEITEQKDSKSPLIRAPTFSHRTIAKSVAEGRFTHHRDTFAINKGRACHKIQVKATELPAAIVAGLLEQLDRQTYLTLRLVSRSWNKSVDSIKPPKWPAVFNLPPEIIQAIYCYLLADDCSQTSHAFEPANNFNNARHTCRAWMAVSLDKRLLSWAFLRAGW